MDRQACSKQHSEALMGVQAHEAELGVPSLKVSEERVKFHRKNLLLDSPYP